MRTAPRTGLGNYKRTPACRVLNTHGARIYYEEFGEGFPILTFAPAGLQSVIAVWGQSSAPINPTTEFAANHRVIAMDQRNAGGQSRAPITAQDGSGYLHSRSHRAPRSSPHRSVPSVRPVHRRIVHPQPAQGATRPYRVCCARTAHRARGGFAVRPIRPVRGMGRIAQGPPGGDQGGAGGILPKSLPPRLCVCVDREFASTVRTPCLVLAGNDEAHPYPISEELSRLLPNCEFIPEWKTGSALTLARARVAEFLSKHTPHRA